MNNEQDQSKANNTFLDEPTSMLKLLTQLLSSQPVNRRLLTEKCAVLASWDREKHEPLIFANREVVNRFAKFELEQRGRTTSFCCQW